jgi:PD-(D/E)XK nuclease superfamily protein
MIPAIAAEKFHWIKVDEQNRIIELYCDHHMLSTLRMCEVKFTIEHIANIRPKGHLAWNLVFGLLLHNCNEAYYKSIKDSPNGTPFSVQEFLEVGKAQWKLLNLDAYKETEKFKKVGGYDGMLSLLVQYYAYYMSLRMRIVDAEIAFGKAKEVPLGEFIFRANYWSGGVMHEDEYDRWTVKCYLTGRIDLLVDNGYKIGIVDHKSHASFRGDEYLKFNPQDGITGYIYAINCLMKQLYPAYFEQGKRCMTAWIYHISQSSPSKSRTTGQIGPRFKATIIEKNEGQLEEYRLRQIETFKRVAELVFNDKNPEWSTHTCANVYGNPCEYRPIHESPSEEWDHILRDHYHVTLPWNPLKPDDSALERDEVLKAQELVTIQEMNSNLNNDIANTYPDPTK